MNKITTEYLYDISIIIITYNSKDYILNCINSFFESEKVNALRIEIIVIDNNSSDRTSDMLDDCLFFIRLISNNDNVGFAKACNQGIIIARGKYVFILNPDTRLLNNALRIFYDFMEKEENENIWCVGGQLLNEKNESVKSTGKFPNLLNLIIEQTGLKRIFLKIISKEYFLRRNTFHYPKVVDYIIGCNMFIRSKSLGEIGLFNEEFFLNYEETELAWRAKKKGYKSVIIPSARILHYSGKSFSDKKSYLSSLYLGQIIFLKWTRNTLTFKIAKIIHLFGTIVRYVVKNDSTYLMHLKKIHLIK